MKMLARGCEFANYMFLVLVVDRLYADI